MTSSWYMYSVGAAAAFTGLALTFKWLAGALPASVTLTYIAGLSTIVYALHAVRAKASFALSWEQWGVIILATVFAYFGNLFDLEGIRLAPNAGYATAIKGCQVIFITLIAYFLFAGQQLSLMGVLGVLLVFLGGILLGLQPGG